MSDDFSFDAKSKKDIDGIHSDIDNKLGKKPVKEEDIVASLDRVKFANDIRKHPPKDGFMKVDFWEAVKTDDKGKEEKGIAIKYEKDGKEKVKFTKGLFGIDLNTDADWWFNRACTVFPLILDQAVRTHVDIRDSFKPEKRRIDFPYLWIAAAVVGVIFISVIFLILFGG